MTTRVVPGVYEHYKGGQYVVLGLARHHESGLIGVVYHPVDPHGVEETIEWNWRPLYGTPSDPDGWFNEVKSNGIILPVPRFCLLYPIGGGL